MTENAKKYDVILIGGGPAGMSAAIYIQRAGLSSALLSFGGGSLLLAEKIENYFGIPGVSGSELLKRGREQVEALGGEFVDCEATSVEGTPGAFEVRTTAGVLNCAAVIFATGSSKKKPKIAGLDDFTGRGVSYCAVCDGFFFRGKTVGVLGAGDYAADEAAYLSHLSDRITIFTNGKKPVDSLNKYTVNTDAVKSVSGSQRLERIEFADGTYVSLDGLFIAEGSASAGELALKMGVAVTDGKITCDRAGCTNVDGVYAAGDCTGGFLQVSCAVGEGANAGNSAAKYVKKMRK